jgi:hypothetical protein
MKTHWTINFHLLKEKEEKKRLLKKWQNEVKQVSCKWADKDLAVILENQSIYDKMAETNTSPERITEYLNKIYSTLFVHSQAALNASELIVYNRFRGDSLVMESDESHCMIRKNTNLDKLINEIEVEVIGDLFNNTATVIRENPTINSISKAIKEIDTKTSTKENKWAIIGSNLFNTNEFKNYEKKKLNDVFSALGSINVNGDNVDLYSINDVRLPKEDHSCCNDILDNLSKHIKEEEERVFTKFADSILVGTSPNDELNRAYEIRMCLPIAVMHGEYGGIIYHSYYSKRLLREGSKFFAKIIPE